jgi:hypothetical protein
MGIYIIRKENGKAKFVPVKKGRILNDTIEILGIFLKGIRSSKKGMKKL